MMEPYCFYLLCGFVFLPFIRSYGISSTLNEIGRNADTKELRRRSFSATRTIKPIYQNGLLAYMTIEASITTEDDVYSPNLIVDTGSFIPWMLSDALDRKVFPENLHQFLPVLDDDCAPTVIEYGTGDQGVEVRIQPQEVLTTLAGLDLPEFHIGAAISLSNQGPLWTISKIDGILGMDMREGGWLSEISEAYADELDRFTIDVPGQRMVFEDTSHVLTSTDPIYADLSAGSDQKWIFDSADRGQILIDSGTPFLFLAAEWANEWLDATGRENWRYAEVDQKVVPQLKCNSSPDPVRFKIGEDDLSLPGKNVIGLSAEPTNEWCTSKVYVQAPGEPSYLGLAFFEQYIITFEYSYKKLGFSRAS